MKLLCQRDGTLIGRIADDQLTFPVPADVCVISSAEDLSVQDLPNGSILREVMNAKLAAFQGSHPTFDYSFQTYIDLISPHCDTINSNKVISGYGNSTALLAGYGATWTSDTISCPGVNVSICARLNFFLLGRKSAGSNQKFYNYDEVPGNFVDDPLTGFSCLYQLVDAVDPGVVIANFTPDVEMPSTIMGLTDFKVQVVVTPDPGYVDSNVRLYISDFLLLTKAVLA